MLVRLYMGTIYKQWLYTGKMHFLFLLLYKLMLTKLFVTGYCLTGHGFNFSSFLYYCTRLILHVIM